MNYSEWQTLSEAEQNARCPQLNPYEEWDLFKDIEAEFIKKYGYQPGISDVFCGLGSSLGPINCITVKIKRGQKRTAIPKVFMGFPVLRSYGEKEDQTK